MEVEECGGDRQARAAVAVGARVDVGVVRGVGGAVGQEERRRRARTPPREAGDVLEGGGRYRPREGRRPRAAKGIAVGSRRAAS